MVQDIFSLFKPGNKFHSLDKIKLKLKCQVDLIVDVHSF